MYNVSYNFFVLFLEKSSSYESPLPWVVLIGDTAITDSLLVYLI